MPQFDPSTFLSQVFWLLVCFSILICAFVFVFVPRMNALLENRSNKVHHDLERAKMLNEQIEGLLKARTERIRFAEEKAEAIIRATLLEMEDKKNRQFEKVEDDFSKAIQNMKDSVEKQREDFNASLKPLVADCVEQLLPKLLGGSKAPSSKAKVKKKAINV
jgi:F-type H+-transporting ATPase subunit b